MRSVKSDCLTWETVKESDLELWPERLDDFVDSTLLCHVERACQKLSDRTMFEADLNPLSLVCESDEFSVLPSGLFEDGPQALSIAARLTRTHGPAKAFFTQV